VKTSELTGGPLNYWTARAEGVPASELRIQRVPRSDVLICVRGHATRYGGAMGMTAVDYAKGDLFIDLLSRRVDTLHLVGGLDGQWVARVSPLAVAGSPGRNFWGSGKTPAKAICRAVVRAAFGDEVGEVPEC
jgi:hypothetical protein